VTAQFCRFVPHRTAGLCRSVLILAVVAALGGCSLWGGGGAKPVPADLGANVAVLGVRQAWTARIGALAGMPLEVHTAGHIATLASADGVVASIDARTGGDVWRIGLGEPLSAGVGSDGKVAAVVSRANVLIALESGKERWRQSLSAQVFTPPLVAGGRIFVLSADRAISAFDALSGRKLWTQQRPGEALVLRQAGVLRPVGDTLVVGLSGRLVGLNPDNGSVRWEAPLASPRGTNDVERLVELVGSTSRESDSLCARAFQASVGCVNTVRGTVAWTQPASGAEGIHGDGEALFGSESNGSVVAWRRSDGSRLWTTDRLKHRK
jgi:outer membrane protein assembly factor BamB